MRNTNTINQTYLGNEHLNYFFSSSPRDTRRQKQTTFSSNPYVTMVTDTSHFAMGTVSSTLLLPPSWSNPPAVSMVTIRAPPAGASLCQQDPSRDKGAQFIADDFFLVSIITTCQLQAGRLGGVGCGVTSLRTLY